MQRRVSVGDLNRRVSIETYTVSRDSIGQPTKTPSVLATVWAGVKPLFGYELKEGDRIVSDVSHCVTIYYRTDVTAKMRVLYGSRVFDITSVRHDEERRRWTFLDCKEHA